MPHPAFPCLELDDGGRSAFMVPEIWYGFGGGWLGFGTGGFERDIWRQWRWVRNQSSERGKMLLARGKGNWRRDAAGSARASCSSVDGGSSPPWKKSARDAEHAEEGGGSSRGARGKEREAGAAGARAGERAPAAAAHEIRH